MSHKLLRPIDPIHAVYFAGFFDGEGCVGLYERAAQNAGPGAKNPQFAVTLSIANTNLAVLRHIKLTCGGNIGSARLQRPKKDGTPRKTLWRWFSSAREAIHILEHVGPHLIVKREEATVIIEYHRSIIKYMKRPHPFVLGKCRLPEYELERRRLYVQRLMALKRSPVIE